MKTIWILYLCLLAVTAVSTPSQARAIDASNTVRSYFDACRNGDIDTLKILITGPFYDKRRTLLNDNAGYSNFLIGHFEGVEIVIISETPLDAGGGAAVLVERHYPDGSLLLTRFVVVKEDQKRWKIYDEQLVLD